MSEDDRDEPFDYAGRVNLAPPTPEQLEAAAADVLGPGADEALLSDGSKVFRGAAAPGAIFIQGPDESCGTIISQASGEFKDRVMEAAAKVRQARAELEAAKYLDPSENPFIKLDLED